MAASVLVVTKRKRSVLRASITKIINKIETEVKEQHETDEIKLKELLKILEHKFEELKVIEGNLENLLPEEELQQELESADEYTEKIISSQFRATEMLKSLQKTSINDNDVSLTDSKLSYKSNEAVHIKLPKIIIPKFHGDVSQWLSFWNSFDSAIHKNELLDEIDKFNYLKAHLSGTALETIEGFSISRENYVKAIDILKNRFGKSEVLINTHMRNLLQISPLKRSSDVNSFRKLFDYCQIQIRSLESLGVSSETYGSLLCPIIINLLPNDLIFKFNEEHNEKGYTIENLLEFLQRQLLAREKTEANTQHRTLQSAPEKFYPPAYIKQAYKENNNKCYRLGKPKSPSAADLLVTEIKRSKQNKCIFCEELHDSLHCENIKDASYNEKKDILRKKGACFSCLRTNHLIKDCRRKIICRTCGGKHPDVLCYTKNQRTKESSSDNDNTVLSNYSLSNKVYLQTLVLNIRNKNRINMVRAIIDTGSQRSYISKYVANKMQLTPVEEETVKHTLFGGLEHVQKHNKFLIYLSSIDGNFECKMEVMDQKKICTPIARVSELNCIKELKGLGIFVSDMMVSEYSCLYEKDPDEIQILIGSDYAGKIFTGQKRNLSKNLVAIQTSLGWTIMGKKEDRCETYSTQTILSLHVTHQKLADLWELDTLGIKDLNTIRLKNETQKLALEYFINTVDRDEEGRYIVSLPWLEGHSPLMDNKGIALRRLKNNVKSLKMMNKLNDYQKVFEEWEKEGIIERVFTDEKENKEEINVHYLPHRAVFKENSTTKIRPVFDGSAKQKNSVSINECIEKGPNLIELIPSILNRFRWGKIGVIADIRKAFLQIKLNEYDRNFLRFLWFENGDNNKLIIYRHCRVVFGITCSPFMLAAVLNHVFDNAEKQFYNCVKKLRNSMYVDNCVASVDTVSELKKFKTESQQLLSAAKFDLRGWENNEYPIKESMELHSSDTDNIKIPVLGYFWNTINDTLSCNLNSLEKQNKIVTKRNILSMAHRLFDPIGVTCPITLKPKILLQECWKRGVTWDTEVPEDIKKSFIKWKEQLIELKDLYIPRRFTTLDYNISQVTLHVFCDSSKVAYATCIYLRTEQEDQTTCQLIQARSRIAPLKSLSIPRLELLACSIGARLANTVKQDLKLSSIETFYWSDSMDALYWIKGEGPWVTFVNNRVKEIKELTSTKDWRHVPGSKNMADLPSRGCNVKTLLNTKWWEGPVWLKSAKELWPNMAIIPNEQTIMEEKRKTIVSALTIENSDWYSRFSSYTKIIRITGWIYRFYNNIKNSEKRKGELSTKELKNAEITILRITQKCAFEGNKVSPLKTLSTITDEIGLIRLKTKIIMSDFNEEFKLPVILPSKNHIVTTLIREKHIKNGHMGLQSLMMLLRENYWILKARQTIKRIISKCVVCQRFSKKTLKLSEGPLPVERINSTSAFDIIGVDATGPLIQKDKTKIWIIIFTCAVYRAVHLELVTSLSTDKFLLALRRFIARRGRPSMIFSDNGTNFTGAENLLREIDIEKLTPSIYPITWKFIPPKAPWWGGFWERLIGMLKGTLRKILGTSSLDYEELQTVLCDCENYLNSRPLTYTSDNSNDLSPLTPSMFIRDNYRSDTEELDQIKIKQMNNKKELAKRLLYRKKLMRDLRVRFRSEYLGYLRQMNAIKIKAYEPKIGDLVLLANENEKRLNWPLGRILSVYTSRDGIIRKVQVKTNSGVLIRPVQKLCFLELDNDNIDVSTGLTAKKLTAKQPSNITHFGRLIKPPDRYQA